MQKYLLHLCSAITLITLLFLGIFSTQAYAETFYHVGQTDSCDRVFITVNENQVCPRLSGNACTNPTARPEIDDYTFTITVRSNNGQAHTVQQRYSSHFCTDVCGGCADNSQYTNETVTIPAAGSRTFTMTRSSPYGYACGNYQMDYGILSVDGNTACDYSGSTYPIGASAICEAGRACTGPTLAPTPTTNTVTGNIYIDANKNGTKDAGENNYVGPITISSSRGTVTTTAAGTYSISNLTPGALTVSYNSLPTDYSLTYPLNGPPPSFSVIVGPGCNVNGANGAACTGGNISNLNFGITNLEPWIRGYCGSIRLEDGFDNPVPQTANSGPYTIITSNFTNISCTTPGIAFAGDNSYDFGQGSVSNTDWISGGTTYPEVYQSANPSGIATSYTYLTEKAAQAGITPVNLATVCNLSNCTLPANLPHGVYQANTNVNLNTYTFPVNQDYVFLINGDLTVRGNIFTPVGSVAVFSTSGDIIVDAVVGWYPTFLYSNMDGIWSTDHSFIVNSTNTCNDLSLSIAGTVITNASLTGGSFENSRDLCGFDSQYATTYFYQRLDMILNMPEFMKVQNNVSWEVAP